MKKFPAGGANRWESRSLFINNTLSLSDLRLKEECIAQYNQTLHNVVSSAGSGTDSSNNAGTSPNAEKAHDANSLKESEISLIPGCDWTTEQDALLQEGLKKYPSTMEKYCKRGSRESSTYLQVLAATVESDTEESD